MRVIVLIGLLLCSCASVGTKKRGLFDASAPTPSFSSDQSYCPSMNEQARLDLLALADPANFPKTKYRLGSWKPVEKETDCSRFVYEIYKRAGFPFGFRTSRELKNAPEFVSLPESEAMPGDLMVFRGHVGIVAQDGRIISATRTRGRRKSAITRIERDNFRPSRGGEPVLRYRCAENFVVSKPFVPQERVLASTTPKRKAHRRIQRRLSKR